MARSMAERETTFERPTGAPTDTMLATMALPPACLAVSMMGSRWVADHPCGGVVTLEESRTTMPCPHLS
jgi:hypothetical protein